MLPLGFADFNLPAEIMLFNPLPAKRWQEVTDINDNLLVSQTLIIGEAMSNHARMSTCSQIHNHSVVQVSTIVSNLTRIRGSPSHTDVAQWILQTGANIRHLRNNTIFGSSTCTR